MNCYRCRYMVVLDPATATQIKRTLGEAYHALDLSNPLISKRILDARNTLDMALFQAIPPEDLGG